jgi:ABC-type multidrug transport system ATPase subunit
VLGLLLESVKGSTLFFTTHIGDDAEIAGRVAFLSGGEIRDCDSPAALKRKYANGEAVHVRVSVRTTNTDEVVRLNSRGGMFSVVNDGYRAYVEDARAVEKMSQAFAALNLSSEITQSEVTLDDAFVLALGGSNS